MTMNISAVLLAGGESRRMGEDKATLQFRGHSLWQIQIDLLRGLRPAEIVISAKTDPPWRPRDARFVPDDPPSRGPLSGLAAALRQIRSSHLLALAIDMPFMSESHLRFLCEQIESGRGILPMIRDRAEPLAAIYPAEADVDVVAALSGTDFSLQSLTRHLVEIDKLGVIQMAGEMEFLYRNLNEVEDCDSERKISLSSVPRSFVR